MEVQWRLKYQVLADEIGRSKLSQNAWARRIGVSRAYLSLMVNGKRLYPNRDVRRRMVEAFDLTADELFEIEGPTDRRLPRRLVGPIHIAPKRVEIWVPSLRLDPSKKGDKIMRVLLDELKIVLRTLARSPGFAFLSVLILALGIGANTAIFSVSYAVLFKPLEYSDPARLTMVWLDNRNQGWHEDITSYPNYLDWKERNQIFHSMAGYNQRSFNLAGEGHPQRISGGAVTASFFQVLGVEPQLGTIFQAEEEQQEADRSVVISHGFWQAYFGGSLDVLARSLNLSGRTFKVIGVMPEGFQFPAQAQLWVPLAPSERLRQARGALFLPVIGRLKEGVTLEEAQAEMDAIGRALETEYPETNTGYGINLEPMHESLVGEFTQPVTLLMLAVAFVLLIACANMANLMLARAATRERELGIRKALGASRVQIIRQFSLEGMVLAMIGGAVGLLVAFFGVRLLVGTAPEGIPRLESAGVNLEVLGFTLLVSIFAGLVFGTLPPLLAASPDPAAALKEGGRTLAGSHKGSWVRKGLVVSEVALSLILLIAAALMIRSLQEVRAVNPGFNPDRLLTFSISLPGFQYPNDVAVIDFYSRLLDRLRALPDVEDAGATSAFFIPELANSTTFHIEGRSPLPPSERVEIPIDSVTPGFFEAVGTPLLEGRDFQTADNGESRWVAVINETMAQQFWPGQSPVGQRYKYGDVDSDSPWIEIIGVVGDIKRSGLERPVRPSAFHSYRQRDRSFMTVMARTKGDPVVLVDSVRAEVEALDPGLPIFNVLAASQLLADSMAHRRFQMFLLSLFALVALLLASAGIYGVISYTVSQSTQSIGVRMALGASRSSILRLVLRQGLTLTGLGILVGIVAAPLLSDFLSGLLFGIRPFDPPTLALVALFLLLVSALATLIPARRAISIEPLEALRYE